MLKPLVFTVLAMIFSTGLHAGEVDVVDVKVHLQGPNTFSFDVTLKHDDAGWKHYANRWEIVGPKGVILATRTLHHPHVNEQPFTRSLSGVKIPVDVDSVTLRGHDLVHKTGGKEMIVKLPR